MALAVGLLVGLVPLAPAAQAAARKPLATVRVTAPTPVTPSATLVVLKGRATGKFRATFVVQRKVKGTWRKVRTFRGAKQWTTTVKLATVPSTFRIQVSTARGPVRSKAVTVRKAPVLAQLSSIPLDQYDAQRTLILQATNDFRASYGLPPLKPMTALDLIATRWSERMAANRVMSHNPTYWTQFPAGASKGGENVGFGWGPTRVVQEWIKSPGHRANLLGDFNRIGIGMAKDVNGVPYYTQDFAKY